MTYTTTWDFTKGFLSNTPSELLELRTKIIEAYNTFFAKWKDNTTYLTHPKALREYLDEYEYLSREYGVF
jgi:hypothetical protein